MFVFVYIYLYKTMNSKINRNKASSVWAYFSVVDAYNKNCRCDMCGLVMSYRTTIHKSHIERKHVDLNINIVKPKSSSVSTKESEGDLPTTSSNSVDCPREPIHIDETDDGEFSELVLAKPPNSKPKQHSTLTNCIPKKINITQKKQLIMLF